VKGCTQARIAKVKINGVPMLYHGTGLCFGQTINVYALNAPFANSKKELFIEAVAGIASYIRSTR
jgi:hypothetical protein